MSANPLFQLPCDDFPCLAFVQDPLPPSPSASRNMTRRILQRFALPLPASFGLLLTLALALHPCSAADTSFVFNGFPGTNMSLAGIAAYENGFIRLTNISSRLFGRALYPNQIHVKNATTNVVSSFSTTFVFAISPLYSTIGGHGMAFIMTPSLDPSNAFPSQYLGILNATNNGDPSDHIFAVEFDTVMDLEFADINDNHVGINLNSMTSNHSAPAGYWTAPKSKVELDLKGGDEIQAWIQYDGFSQQLNVSIAPVGLPQPNISLISVRLDLSHVLKEYMFVGFSGSTGIISGTHRVLSWSFNSNGLSQSLDLSKLPRIVPKPSLYETKHFIIAVSVAALAFLVLITALTITAWQRWSQREIVEDWELEFGLLRYSYKELRTATKKFHEKGLLGVGGFGRVYRGVLPGSGLVVAVKRLSRESDQGEREFLAEMSSMGRLRHRNLVPLLGWSRRKGELLLVYEYMPNGSLDKMLFGKSIKSLRWQERYKVLKGVAEGMLYLHEGWEQQVLHRDIKASNVLLDADMNGRLGDFGLARLHEHGQNPHTTRVVGTLGYLAPEFARTGKATPSTDVYSFGALLLEVATGKRPMDHVRGDEDFLLVDGVWNLYVHGKLLDAVDRNLGGDYVVEEMERVLHLGLLCSHFDPLVRPTMRQVVQMLANGAPLPPLPPGAVSGTLFDELNAFKHDPKAISLSSSSARTWSTMDASTNISAR